MGIKTVILPRPNERDLEDVPAELRQEMRFVFATRVDEVLAAALDLDGAESTVPPERSATGLPAAASEPDSRR